MSIFKKSFEKTAKISTLFRAGQKASGGATKLFKKTLAKPAISKAPTKPVKAIKENVLDYSQWLKPKRTPQPERVLNAAKNKSDFATKQMAERSQVKRRLSDISGKPEITTKDRYPWAEKVKLPSRTLKKKAPKLF